MNGKKRISIISICVLLLIIVLGHLLFAQFKDYTYNSDKHIKALLLCKLWSFIIIAGIALIIYWRRHQDYAPLIAVFGVTIYFIVIYGLLFRGTQYGLNGHWGDNGYRLATICKMMAYNNFADAYVKDLTSMYPPLWFYAMALYAKIIGIEAWQTLKFGYLFLFIIYPWLIYLSWRPLVSSATAAAVAVATVFFAHNSLDYVCYEHITAALFMPWWIYYFEDGKDIAINNRPRLTFYIAGILIGSAIFLTYYYWFFVAIAAFPVTLVVRYHINKSFGDMLMNIRHKAILAAGITIISSVYWAPLILSGIKYGFESYQITWFGIIHANIMSYWYDQHLRATFVLGGIFFAAYLWNRWGNARLLLYLCGAVILILLDRFLNLNHISNQTRKILQFVHVITIAPLAIGLVETWKGYKTRPNIRWGALAILIVLFFVIANEQLELYQSKLYQSGVNSRYPTAALDVFKDIDCRNKVILTDKYAETCYLPFFMFTPVSNVPAHLAARFQERGEFLKAVSQIDESEILAYSFVHNKFDKIDYVYLPYNATSECYEFRMNIINFDKKTVLDTISIKASIFSDTCCFGKIHGRGLFEVKPLQRSVERDRQIKESYPQLEKFIASVDDRNR